MWTSWTTWISPAIAKYGARSGRRGSSRWTRMAGRTPWRREQVDHYDYIIAAHVLEHLPDPLGFLSDSAPSSPAASRTRHTRQAPLLRLLHTVMTTGAFSMPHGNRAYSTRPVRYSTTWRSPHALTRWGLANRIDRHHALCTTSRRPPPCWKELFETLTRTMTSIAGISPRQASSSSLLIC